ncbi:MAG: hydroxyacylglutathione hydrolase [Vibrionaceae bacterium]
MLTVTGIPSLNDNYIWLIQNSAKRCVAIDPGEAQPLLQHLQAYQLSLDAILLTHHHRDHTDGVTSLQSHHPQVKIFGAAPKKENNSAPFPCFSSINLLDYEFHIIPVPGHTLDHIAFYVNDMLFCGDTLFSAGCGRMFEGEPQQFFDSLQKLANLPDQTKVFCAHEYTLANLQFALAVEPDNEMLHQTLAWATAQRAQNLPTLPSTIGKEKMINPFMRCHIERVKQSVQHTAMDDSTVATFAALRKWKDNFVPKLT